MKKLILGLMLGVMLRYGTPFAVTHYVSKTGSDEYPYTSWETAADSIQKGIDAASAGDTVRVGPGTYRQTTDLIIAPGIALIGAGMDSCSIDGTRNPINPYTIIHGADSSTFEGFHVKGGYSLNGTSCTGIYSSSYGGNLKKIANNKISDCDYGIRAGGPNLNTEIASNVLTDNRTAVYLSGGHGITIRNTITETRRGIRLYGCLGPGIIKNLIMAPPGGTYGIDGEFVDSVFIENNLVVGYQTAVRLRNYSGQFETVPVKNNILIGDSLHAVVNIRGFSNEIKNNIISEGFYGIGAYTFLYEGYVWPSNPQVSYNDLWDNKQNYDADWGASIDTSFGGNIYSDPMFVGGDDYHLQYGSPCIDAGDPNIIDPDSSRSDIGCYGGTWGETYTYQDYPPRAPDSLTAASSDTLIILSWKPNTASDLSHYLVYKDTIEGFIPDTFKIVGEVPKDSSVFRDYDVILGGDYYYRVSAWDLTGNESDYSDELQVQATDVGEFTEEGPPMPRMYQVRQNYPNPFNPRTTIVYYLPDVGYQPAEVEIVIYNLLGQKVRILVKERKYPGEHRVSWDGKDDEGNDLASGIYFYKLTFSGVDLYPLVKPKKMVLIR